uniref:Transmembrane protein n=1 Tax=Globodera rostochiensis TaxID=31243 RepID=A0A914IB82_GLORO
MKALKVENVGINGGALTSVDGRRRKPWLLLVFNFAFFLYHAIAIKKDCPGFFNTNTSNTIQLGSVQP